MWQLVTSDDVKCLLAHACKKFPMVKELKGTSLSKFFRYFIYKLSYSKLIIYCNVTWCKMSYTWYSLSSCNTVFSRGSLIYSQMSCKSRLPARNLWLVTHGQVFRKDYKFRLTPVKNHLMAKFNGLPDKFSYILRRFFFETI